MLFGNRNTVGFEISPLVPSWERRYLPEQTGWGALAIWVNGLNLCAHLEPGSDEVQAALNVPLAPVADWLVRAWPFVAFEERATRFPTTGGLHQAIERWGRLYPPTGQSEDDWTDSRAQWWERHFLVAGADGAILPNLALGREDEKLMLDWDQPRLAGGAPRFLEGGGSAAVPWSEAEPIIAAFVAYIAEWLQHDRLSSLYPWVTKKDPLQSAAEGPWQILALYTGRTEQELRALTEAADGPEVFMRLGLDPRSSDPAGSPTTQALRDLPPSLPPAAADLLATLEEGTRAGSGAGLWALRDIATDASRDFTSPVASGYEAASAVRRQLGLDGTPLPEFAEVFPFVGISVRHEEVELNRARMITGLRRSGGAMAMVLKSERTKAPWGRRFELARALGHLLTDPIRGGALGAASSPYSSDLRRRRSGAFAAELLLPKSALLQLTHGEVDRAADPQLFRHLLGRFGVGASTAAHHIWNVGLLSSPDVRDELIDSYSAR